MTPSPDPPANGFTLVELMVSLLVFGMIAAASALLLATAVDSQARVAKRLDRSAELRRANALLTSDLAQAVVRPTRDPQGGVRPAFAGGGPVLAALVRGGWANPDAAPRPGLQRIDYALRGDMLVRTVHDQLDGSGIATALPLVTGLAGARTRYRTVEGWRDAWDPVDPADMPRALELTLVFADGRTIVQRLLVAS